MKTIIICIICLWASVGLYSQSFNIGLRYNSLWRVGVTDNTYHYNPELHAEYIFGSYVGLGYQLGVSNFLNHHIILHGPTIALRVPFKNKYEIGFVNQFQFHHHVPDSDVYYSYPFLGYQTNVEFNYHIHAKKHSEKS